MVRRRLSLRWSLLAALIGVALVYNEHLASVSSEVQQQQQQSLSQITLRPPALGDGCYHVFIDAGSNRGVHGRFLFEPEKYPKSKFTLKFDEMFGHNRTLQNICVFAFEPNVQKHQATQRATEQAYAQMGWRYKYIPYGVSDRDGQVTFYRNWNFFNGAKREEWGFGTHAHGDVNDTMKVVVDILDLAKWSEQHVFDRQVPPKNEYNRAHPVVAMKMDVEGSEYRTLDHMMEQGGTACKFDYIVGELHYEDFPQSFGRHNLTSEKMIERYATKVMKKRLSRKGCPTFLEFDDEEYLHDGQPYPVP